MNTRASQPTLREWRSHMGQPARLVGLVGTAAILTLVGPFNTAEVMRALPRLAYWLMLVVATYAIGYAAHIYATRRLRSLTLRIAVSGLLTGLGAFALIYVLNGAAFGYWPMGRALALLAGNVMAIAVIVSAIFHYADGPDTEADQQGPPPLLDRLPIDKRGALVSISVEDHYVRIRTTKGEEMVLMRLSDAIRETGATEGLQVHRSHWVAKAAVAKATRKGDGATLTMATGPDIPVSRANIPALREAGLLPA